MNPSSLSPELRDSYRRDGFVLISNFFDAKTVQAMKDSYMELLRNWQPDSTAAAFSTKSPKQQADDHFRTSGDRITFFLEADAPSASEIAALPVDAKARFINKCAHSLHRDDPVFRDVVTSKNIVELIRTLGVGSSDVAADPCSAAALNMNPLPTSGDTVMKCIQSMVIAKPGKIGGAVVPHKDDTFLSTSTGQSVVGFWTALDDARIDNSCLWVVPGSHREKAATRWEYDEASDDMITRGEAIAPPDTPGTWVPVEVPSGGLLVFNGSLWHRSYDNTSESSRMAFTFHCIPTDTTLTPKSWLGAFGCAEQPIA